MTQGIRPVAVGSSAAVQRLEQTHAHLQTTASLAPQATFNSSNIAANTAQALSAPPPGGWHPPSSAELKEAFSNSDKIFARHLESAPESKQWLEDLSHCIRWPLQRQDD